MSSVFILKDFFVKIGLVFRYELYPDFSMVVGTFVEKFELLLS
jgi:hypothetical protein